MLSLKPGAALREKEAGKRGGKEAGLCLPSRSRTGTGSGGDRATSRDPPGSPPPPRPAPLRVCAAHFGECGGGRGRRWDLRSRFLIFLRFFFFFPKLLQCPGAVALLSASKEGGRRGKKSPGFSLLPILILRISVLRQSRVSPPSSPLFLPPHHIASFVLKKKKKKCVRLLCCTKGGKIGADVIRS